VSTDLAFGIFSVGNRRPRVGARLGDHVLDVGRVLGDPVFKEPTLNGFLAAGRGAWTSAVERLTRLIERDAAPLVPLSDAKLHLPFAVGDYVDFYSSIDHATNVGRMFRPDEPLFSNWRHLPIGYHGRAGTVVVSGTPIVRPSGQQRVGDDVRFGPTSKLDIEAEVGFVIGVGSPLGRPVSIDDVGEHIFGVVLLNDWSARDFQAWESKPLGPFLGKSFATSISPWVVPLDALAGARIAPPRQDPPPLPYLTAADAWGLDIALEVRLNGDVISRPAFKRMYWTPAQQLAHLTANGARLRAGDLFASGTVSGPTVDERGSLIELTWDGRDPIALSGGSTRTYLEDGDTVTISATAAGIDLGQVTGTIAG
jgi:fumarylacetoacetase